MQHDVLLKHETIERNRYRKQWCFSNVYYISLGRTKAQHIKNLLAKTIAFMSAFLSLTMQRASIWLSSQLPVQTIQSIKYAFLLHDVNKGSMCPLCLSPLPTFQPTYATSQLLKEVHLAWEVRKCVQATVPKSEGNGFRTGDCKGLDASQPGGFCTVF